MTSRTLLDEEARCSSPKPTCLFFSSSKPQKWAELCRPLVSKIKVGVRKLAFEVRLPKQLHENRGQQPENLLVVRLKRKQHGILLLPLCFFFKRESTALLKVTIAVAMVSSAVCEMAVTTSTNFLQRIINLMLEATKKSLTLCHHLLCGRF